MIRTDYFEQILYEKVQPFITKTPPFGDMFILPNGEMLDLTCFKKGKHGFFNWLSINFKSSNFVSFGAEDYLWNMNWIFIDTVSGVYNEAKAQTAKQEKTLNYIKKYYKIKRLST